MFTKRGLLTSIFFLVSLSLALLVGCSQDGGLLGVTGDSGGPTPLSMPGGDRGGLGSFGDVKGEGGLTPIEENPTNGAWIGTRGGSVNLEFATLEIPAGALTAHTYISIERDDPSLATVEFSPDGQQFLVPVTIRMSLDGFIGDGLNLEDYCVALYDEELEDWVELPSYLEFDGDNYTVWAKTTHFSRYALSD